MSIITERVAPAVDGAGEPFGFIIFKITDTSGQISSHHGPQHEGARPKLIFYHGDTGKMTSLTFTGEDPLPYA